MKADQPVNSQNSFMGYVTGVPFGACNKHPNFPMRNCPSCESEKILPTQPTPLTAKVLNQPLPVGEEKNGIGLIKDCPDCTVLNGFFYFHETYGEPSPPVKQETEDELWKDVFYRHCESCVHLAIPDMDWLVRKLSKSFTITRK